MISTGRAKLELDGIWEFVADPEPFRVDDPLDLPIAPQEIYIAELE